MNGWARGKKHRSPVGRWPTLFFPDQARQAMATITLRLELYIRAIFVRSTRDFDALQRDHPLGDPARQNLGACDWRDSSSPQTHSETVAVGPGS